MKVNFVDGVLTLGLEGSIDFNTAFKVSGDIKEQINIYNPTALNVDFYDVTYLSSAGLRAMLSLSKQFKDKFNIFNVSNDVYDVFNMTGFTSIMNIEKKLREISIEGAKLIGEGYTANVYRIAQDTIVKVFKTDRPIERVRREIDFAKKAFVYGIPTAISFDVVRVGDKLGVVFEMLDCASLCDLMIKYPENNEEYINKYAELCKQITSTVALNSGLPNAKDMALERLDFIKPIIDNDNYDKLYRMISSLPDTNTLVHGDYHIKNILVQNNDFMLIDMDTICLGHKIFEFAAFYCTYLAYPEGDPGNIERFLGISESTAKKMYYDTINYVCGEECKDKMDEIYEKIMILGSMHIMYLTYYYSPEQTWRIEIAHNHLKELIKKYETLDF